LRQEEPNKEEPRPKEGNAMDSLMMTSRPALFAPGAPGPSLKAKEGFTLLETLIALTVILFGFMALLVMHTGAIRSGTLAEIQTMAVFLAESKIEEFRVRPPASFPDNTPVLEYFNRQGKSTVKPEEAFYTRSVTLKQQVPTQFTDEVTVSVSWSKASPLVYTSVIPR
jgi:Tfp pilus assembly protein PilV